MHHYNLVIVSSSVWMVSRTSSVIKYAPRLITNTIHSLPQFKSIYILFSTSYAGRTPVRRVRGYICSDSLPHYSNMYSYPANFSHRVPQNSIISSRLCQCRLAVPPQIQNDCRVNYYVKRNDAIVSCCDRELSSHLVMETKSSSSKKLPTPSWYLERRQDPKICVFLTCIRTEATKKNRILVTALPSF
ncbi:hypothetical protein ACQKWADRAFT_198708 [Trichoderma austrokoningii]